MKCLLCKKFTLIHICKECRQRFLRPSLYRRTLPSGVEVISFYKYNEIKELLHTKHTPLGYHVFTILAKISLKHFAKEFSVAKPVAVLGIDEQIIQGYSHTAILAHSLKTALLRPCHGKLLAKNRLSYSGKSKSFRQNNPRNFEVAPFSYETLILIDDIITTGTTLNEAVETLRKKKKQTLLCLTLATAKH